QARDLKLSDLGLLCGRGSAPHPGLFKRALAAAGLPYFNSPACLTKRAATVWKFWAELGPASWRKGPRRAGMKPDRSARPLQSQIFLFVQPEVPATNACRSRAMPSTELSRLEGVRCCASAGWIK